MRRLPGVELPFGFADVDDCVSSVSDGGSWGVRGVLVFAFADVEFNAAMLSCRFCATISLVTSFEPSARFSLILGRSMIESDLRCGGVGVCGVTGDAAFDPVGVVSSPFVHASCLMILGDGDPVVSDALAMRSSEERFVCENSFGDIMVPRLEMPKPSIFATAAITCR